VAAFLDDGLPYLQIPVVVEKTLNAVSPVNADSLETVLNADTRARKIAHEFICSL